MTPQSPTAVRLFEFGYTNWRGEFGIRKAIPREVWWGIGTHHGDKPMWFLKAFDLDKQAERDFALRDISALCSPLQDSQELVERLKLIADDPMWADHAEISKATVRRVISALSTPSPRIVELEACLAEAIENVKRFNVKFKKSSDRDSAIIAELKARPAK